MTPKKNYSRYFIILQEDEKGYSLEADKIPSGYAKLEMKNNKCKISYYVQNLRKEKQPYYMILICGKKDVNKIIKLGKLNIDDYGRLDISHEYDIENIADTGISAEKIIGAAIVKFLDTNVVSIMSGFSTTDKPTEWRNYKLADFNKEKKETRTEDIVNEFDEYEQSIELIKVQSDEKDDVVLEHLENQKNVDEVLDTIQRANVESVKKDESLESVKIIGKAEKVETLINVEKDEEVEKVENVEKVEALKRVEKIEKVKNVELNEVESDKKADEIVQQLEAEKNVHEEIDTRISEEVANSNKLKRDIRENVIKEDMDTDKNKEQYKKDNYNNGENYTRDDYPKGAMGDFFKAVAKDFDEVSDFSKEIKWCR